MRLMEVPPFPPQMEIPDLEFFLRSRVSETLVMWPCQAIPLLGYMCCPNDEGAREALVRTLHSWPKHSGSGPPPVPSKLGRVQADWLKVADIFHCYRDLIGGQHYKRRGGPSIGKAITLVAATAESRGTGEANLWKLWGAYKDVAHLVTAATLICLDVRKRFRAHPPAPAGLSPTQFVPFQMTLLMPDLVLAVAMEFERFGLEPSFADAIKSIEQAAELSPQQRAQWTSALRQIAKAIGRPMATLPARLTAMRFNIERLHPAVVGVNPKTLANQKSNAKDALRWFGKEHEVAPRGVPMSAEWAALRDGIGDYGRKARLSGFMRYCSGRGIQPAGADEAALHDYFA